MPTWYKFWARTGPNVSIISSISTAPPRFEACVQSRAPGWWPPTHCLPSDSGWVRSSRFTQYRFPKARLSRLTKGPELSFFFLFWELFLELLFCPFYLQFAAFWSWKLPFKRYRNILEFEPLIFHGICNILVLKRFMLDGILRLDAAWVHLGLC